MQDADHYRLHAEECERMARRSPLPADRETFRKMADEWRRLEQAAAKRRDIRS
ncbi:MAG TPA: hypothetical protein VEA15_05805 [Caulobacteraceae bacterium]|nr:hypothetical protein [Caulobacteraceae bacterium]